MIDKKQQNCYDIFIAFNEKQRKSTKL